MIAAARLPLRSDPAKSQFFLLCKAWHKRNYPQPEIMSGMRRRWQRAWLPTTADFE
jgi:hypothetical protein